MANTSFLCNGGIGYFQPKQKLWHSQPRNVPRPGVLRRRHGGIRSTLTVPPAATVLLPTGSRPSVVKEREIRSPPLIVDPEEKEKRDAEEAFWDYQFLYRSQRNEVESIPLTLTDGAIPADLSGVYYLCGPGMMSDDHGSQVHPLDGHGYLRKFVIDGTKPVMYSAKYVETEARREEFDEENKTWKFTYRGPFSLLRGGDRFGNVKVMKNVANTCVLQWAGRLMCLYEGGQPYEMDSKSLKTLGLFNHMDAYKRDLGSSAKQTWRSVVDSCSKLLDVSGSVRSASGSVRSAAVGLVGKLIQPILKGIFEMPEERMLSHVKYDEKRKRLVVMTCRREDMVLPKSTLTVYEMNLSMEVVKRRTFTLNEQIMIHDWGLTENHYVLVANKVKLNTPGDIAGSLSGMQPMINCLALDDSLSYSPLYILPRGNEGTALKRDWKVPVKVPERHWLIHTANSFEETDDDGNIRITLDGTACSYEWFSLMHMFGYEWQKRWLDPTFMNKPAKCNSAKQMKNPVQLIRISTLISAEGKELETDYQEFENNTFACDFPAIHPGLAGSKNEHTYLVGASGCRKDFPYFPFDTLLKMSGDAPDAKIKTWWAGKRNFVGEPVFVPRAGSVPFGHPEFIEDDGYLISIQYAAAEEVCYLIILDARLLGIADALVARLRLPPKYAFPYGFHGMWTDHQQDADPRSIHSPLLQ